MVDQHIIKDLERERDRLAAELERLKGETASSGEWREGSPFGKREEEADETIELEKRLVMEKHLTDSLNELNRAVAKAKSGSYGICDLCGIAIEPARLEAMPQAALCLKCKSKQAKDNRGRSVR